MGRHWLMGDIIEQVIKLRHDAEGNGVRLSVEALVLIAIMARGWHYPSMRKYKASIIRIQV